MGPESILANGPNLLGMGVGPTMIQKPKEVRTCEHQGLDDSYVHKYYNPFAVNDSPKLEFGVIEVSGRGSEFRVSLSVVQERIW